MSATGVSAINVNDVFSSNYTNYKVIFDNIIASTTATLTFRMRNAGTDRTGGVYSYVSSLRNFTAGTLTLVNAANQTSGGFSGVRATIPLRMATEFYSPFVSTTVTDIAGLGVGYVSTTTNYANFLINYGTADSNDGFSLITSTGTISGSVKVYGYKE